MKINTTPTLKINTKTNKQFYFEPTLKQTTITYCCLLLYIIILLCNPLIRKTLQNKLTIKWAFAFVQL